MKLRGGWFFAIITEPFFPGIIRLKKSAVRAWQAGEIPVPIPSKGLTLELSLPAIPQGTECLGKILKETSRVLRVAIRTALHSGAGGD
jgi:hypothetical protein